MHALDRAALMDALSELIAVLRLRGVTGRMQVFGGAALTLCHFDRGTTVDIDARLRFDADVQEAVALVAEEARLGIGLAERRRSALHPGVRAATWSGSRCSWGTAW
ncbi:hypothetical protein [Clavibacter zhangzhiyongii]|uniref:hypothetical protein n=1 Tax=Clavibacter zhangzhiyongii TaxID=2768071 RepID=UPI0039E10D63